MQRLIYILIFFVASFALPQRALADAIDSLESVLRERPQIQEKIYIHTDNSCYFVGDTLWYKAYVLRSDDLKPTNLSKLLYVELLSPDGIVVERQHIVVSENGYTCGQFELKDSLYSGYYEIRAYTKWDLNFNVTEKMNTLMDRRKFYNKQIAADFFRDFEGLYSRVVPVYSKPQKEGDWSQRYMYHRPKQRLQKDKVNLACYFYPEGGHLVDGVKTRVAYELTDTHGQAMDLEGTLSNGTKTKPVYMGKGVFEITPSLRENIKVTFQCDGKDYTFKLPSVEKNGATLAYNPSDKTVAIAANGVQPAALCVTCRGKVAYFSRLNGNSVSLADKGLTTGINEVIIYDANAQPLASRLIFVNNNDMGGNIDVKLTINGSEVGSKTTLSPYTELGINVKAEAVAGAYPKTVSVAVRDASTDEPGYNDGNILTDMLLSGDLKGFVAYPAYYFEKDDAEHVGNLDLLLMVQGWRKYKRIESARYVPERGLTYEGRVLKIPSTIRTMELDDLDGIGNIAHVEEVNIGGLTIMEEETEGDNTGIDPDADTSEDVEFAETDYHTASSLRKPVYVEAELTIDGKVVGAVAETDKRGNFRINLPAYYDSAVLFVKAYSKSDSLKKCLTATKSDKGRLDEREIPDYYVKRDMFFPIYSQPYSWYQVNSPDIFYVDEEEDDELIPSNSKLAGNHTLQTVVVKAKRRGRRGIDRNKPAYVRDAYEIYNDVTDYGLSFGVLNFMNFPRQVATFLYGNMGLYNQFNIRAMSNDASFFRNYTPSQSEFDKNVAQTKMFSDLRLTRTLNVRAYTDYEIRTDSGVVHETNLPDVTLIFEPVPDDGKRYTYRDRRYIYPGITYAEEYYRRDYNNAALRDPKDYRRTLYWNPNAPLNEDGQFTDTFFSNAKDTRVKVSAAGVNGEGKLYSN